MKKISGGSCQWAIAKTDSVWINSMHFSPVEVVNVKLCMIVSTVVASVSLHGLSNSR